MNSVVSGRGGRSTVASYLIDRLHELGLNHVFGVPGDYILSLYALLQESPIRVIGTTREDCAGFAADAYARLNGIGCACVTYCVGGLNTVNAVACAYAERSPVVLLSGSPGAAERIRTPLMHHMVRDFSTQKDVFEKITVASAILDDPATAAREIERVLEALQRYKRPVYLEIPRDMVHVPLSGPPPARRDPDNGNDPAALAEALEDALTMLRAAKNPVALAGAEVHRFGLQKTMIRLVERLNIPVATTLLGKSVIEENHPLALGVYGGLVGREEVQEFVHNADCVLLLGTVLSDIDVAATTLDEGRAISLTADRIAIRRHRYDNVRFTEFLTALAEGVGAPGRQPELGVDEAQSPRRLMSESRSCVPDPRPPLPLSRPDPAAPITLASLFAHVNDVLTDETLVIADVGESLFAAADLRIRGEGEFLSPAYYTSMGFAVPAMIGACFAAPKLRPLVFVGDGAFQMTGSEFSTAVRNNLNPIVIVLNNRGYSTEREILDGPFNDVQEWNYEKLTEVVGGGVGLRVRTHGEFVSALETAFADCSQAYLMNVLLDPADRSPGMVRLAKRLAAQLAA